MATTAALMPIMAQSFVQGDHHSTVNGVAFEMVASSSSSTHPTPILHKPKTPPKRPYQQEKGEGRRTSGSAVAQQTTSTGSNGANDIFSLTDVVLASKFQFVEEIGFGNWGSVWLCRPKEDQDPNAKVAIKLVHRSKSPTSSARVRSLWTEFKSIRSLRSAGPHPNLIAFHQFIITSSYALVVMDYHPRLMPVELTESKARSYFQGMVKGVDWLHLNGITHNDIKPANVMLSQDDQPVLVDFGFAQTYPDPNAKNNSSLTSPPRSGSSTAVGSSAPRFFSSLSWGTPEYLSPERARGDLHDERLSDIWALGCTMYEVVVGRTPFEENETEEFLTRDALTVYYHRTSTGRFYGKTSLSSDFAALIRSMIEPSVHLRLQSCGKALRSRFFDPPSALKKQSSYASTAVSTPVSMRTSSVNVTPSSSARRKRVVPPPVNAQPIKVYEDSPTSTAASVTATSTPRRTPEVLSEKKSFVNVSTSPLSVMRAKAANSPVATTGYKTPPAPSRIPVRKPAPSIDGLTINAPPMRTFTPKKIVLANKAKVPAKLSLSAAALTPPAHRRTFSGVGADRPVVEEARKLKKERRKTSPAKSSPPKVLESSSSPAPSKAEEEDETEVLSPNATKSRFSLNSRSILSRSSPNSPLDSYFSPLAPFGRNRSSTQPQIDINLAASLGKHKSELDLSSYNRTSPLKPNTFASKFRKLSLRRAPSSLSFHALKSSISHVGKRRGSTTSNFSFIEPEPISDDHKAMTMPITLSQSKHDLKQSDTIGAQRARLESFSRHIQTIIDARKPVDQLTKKSLAAKVSRAEQPSATEMAILTPYEVHEFTQQVAQELESEERQKSMSKDEALAPRAMRSGSVSRSTRVAVPTSPTERIPVKIRPSLAPSFVGTGSSGPAEREPASSIASTASSIYSTSTSGEFRRGHRRIPTAIRSVPSILLTESADDESSSEYDRTETPCSDRVMSPPPTARLVEPARQLPTWVPEELSSEGEDDGDVDEPDEPTITIRTPVATTLKKRPSRISSATASATGLYHQFVKATPGIERRGQKAAATSTSPPAYPFPSVSESDYEFEPIRSPSQAEGDSRCSSRATDQSGLSRKRSVVSLFFSSKSGSRAPTPSPSLSSLSSYNLSEAESSATGVSRAGKLKRAMKKLLGKS